MPFDILTANLVLSFHYVLYFVLVSAAICPGVMKLWVYMQYCPHVNCGSGSCKTMNAVCLPGHTGVCIFISSLVVGWPWNLVFEDDCDCWEMHCTRQSTVFTLAPAFLPPPPLNLALDDLFVLHHAGCPVSIMYCKQDLTNLLKVCSTEVATPSLPHADYRSEYYECSLLGLPICYVDKALHLDSWHKSI